MTPHNHILNCALVCDWQVRLKNCHYAAYNEYSQHQQHEKRKRKTAKEDAELESLYFAEWTMKHVVKGQRVLVLYED